MPLSGIQASLCRLYDIRVSCEVADYVCDRSTVEATAGSEHERGEVLIVVEEADGLTVGLYVDPAAVEHLETADGDAWMDEGRRWAACLATEGVSHFLYLVFRVDSDTSVSQLELELQAEVDKYASAVLGQEMHSPSKLQGMLEGNGVGAIRARSREVRRRLFHDAKFIDDPGSAEGDRYRVAHHRAARYTASLERRFLDRGDIPAFLQELRRFYRRGLRGKLEASQ
ncbi:MAG: hypothetical protein DRJ42_21960 [Deltaproteobacteria bacterium]|nr:MAG: hypothetical protein DRJ42_21960 [Deltaproteobacteria bacterium]